MAAGTRTFVMRFVGDVKGLVRDLNQIDDKLGGMSGAGKLALGAGLAAGAAAGAVAVNQFQKAISVAGDYERAIGAVTAVSQASAAEQKGLWDKGLEVGMKTKFSALESAQAMEVLAKNGITATDIMDGALDATTALAAAGGTDLVTAADTVSMSMGIWGLKTKDMTNIVNRLGGAANASLFDIEDFNLGIAQGGGVAALSGVEFDDYITLLALTSSTFASGSDAGTSFKTMFTKLNPQTKAARQEMQELGLWTAEAGSAFYDANGRMKDAKGIVQTLNDATKDLTEQEKTQAFMKIFGTDAIRAAGMAAVFSGAQFEEMDKKIRETDSMALAKQRMDNAKDSMEQLNGAIEVIQISVGQKFLPVVKTVALWLAENLPKIPTELFIAIGAFMVFIGTLSAVGLALLPIISLFGMAGMAGAAVALGPLIAAAFPFLLVAAAIAAIIAAGVLLITHWDEVKAKAREVWESIQNFGVTGSGHAGGGTRSLSAQGADARAKLGITAGQVAQWEGVAQGFGAFGNGIDVQGESNQGGLGGIQFDNQYVDTRGVEDRRTSNGMGNVGMRWGTVNINVEGSVHSDASLQAAFLSAMRTATQRGALGF